MLFHGRSQQNLLSPTVQLRPKSSTPRLRRPVSMGAIPASYNPPTAPVRRSPTPTSLHKGRFHSCFSNWDLNIFRSSCFVSGPYIWLIFIVIFSCSIDFLNRDKAPYLHTLCTTHPLLDPGPITQPVIKQNKREEDKRKSIRAKVDMRSLMKPVPPPQSKTPTGMLYLIIW